MKPRGGTVVSFVIVLCGAFIHLSANCGVSPIQCRSDDLTCVERALPAIIWLSTCNYVPPCQNQTVDAPGFNVGETSSMHADCQRINIAHRGEPGSSSLRFARSNDGGLTWYLTDVELGNDLGYSTDIYARGDEVFISSNDQDVNHIRFAYSGDSGKTWANSIVNDPAQVTGNDSSVAVENGEIWVSYMRDGLRIARSNDKGQSWTRILVDGNTNRGMNPSLVVRGDRIFIAHKESGGAQDLILTRSFDGGISWESIVVDSADDVGSSASLVVLGDRLFISYFDNTNTRFLLARSSDIGSTWTVSVLDDSAAFVGSESMSTTDGSNLYAAYKDVTNSTVKVARSLDAGESWQSTVIATGLGIGPYPTVNVRGPGTYVSYEDVSNSTLKLHSGATGSGCILP